MISAFALVFGNLLLCVEICRLCCVLWGKRRVNSVDYVSSLVLLVWVVNGFVFVACCFLVCLVLLICCLLYASWV